LKAIQLKAARDMDSFKKTALDVAAAASSVQLRTKGGAFAEAEQASLMDLEHLRVKVAEGANALDKPGNKRDHYRATPRSDTPGAKSIESEVAGSRTRDSSSSKLRDSMTPMITETDGEVSFAEGIRGEIERQRVDMETQHQDKMALKRQEFHAYSKSTEQIVTVLAGSIQTYMQNQLQSEERRLAAESAAEERRLAAEERRLAAEAAAEERRLAAEERRLIAEEKAREREYELKKLEMELAITRLKKEQ